MKIILAPDSFKGSLTAPEAAEAMAKGVRKAMPEAETIEIPLADGGEGTAESLVAATDGRMVHVIVTGPLGKPVEAAYGILGDNETCVIEMAQASGICLVDPNERDPLKTTTFGTGELIRNALDKGLRRFILALGGSATNDGGIGMLQALGMKLLDAKGKDVQYGGGELVRIETIDDRLFDARIAEADFLIATDVQNPLVGPDGASHVFGPQKGATFEVAELLDTHLTHWANLVEEKTGMRLHDLPGAGAAGGIGGAFQAFFPSRTKRGIDLVIEYARLHEHLPGADCVFTGEGQIDYQTASGKTPMGVAQAAQAFNIPVFALAGSVGEGIDTLYEYGITSAHSIVCGPISLKQAITRAAEFVEQSAEQITRIWLAGQSTK
ncbi:glycerate kinase [Aciduricibacillus chroicocephali]|uniref:Glycerate kinase n=1 Tax=Aciduricibacillus chroicocephali TaxID=3054939 RepID=A0ABY9KSZ2_9BACI|nr:glycerate kinase [Bacillaceae bacterium 44XB]